MKLLNLLVLICFLAGCNQTTPKKAEASLQKITIDTVIVKAIHQKEICFKIHPSEYPKVFGLSNKEFEEKLNKTFKINFTSYVDNMKDYSGNCLHFGEGGRKSYEMFPGSAHGFFVILTANDSVYSILQSFYGQPGGGGNEFNVSAVVTNFNSRKMSLIRNSELLNDKLSLDSINSLIRLYFDNEFKEDGGGINYPFIRDKFHLDSVSFGIRNDSILLITDAYPTGHYSYDIYSIPICRLK